MVSDDTGEKNIFLVTVNCFCTAKLAGSKGYRL